MLFFLRKKQTNGSLMPSKYYSSPIFRIIVSDKTVAICLKIQIKRQSFLKILGEIENWKIKIVVGTFITRRTSMETSFFNYQLY